MRYPHGTDSDLFDDVGEDVTAVMEDSEPPRSEKREPVVRIVEYSRYPRIERSERRMVGFTRNQSRSGLCVVASEAEAEGTLLRVALRTVDGGAALDALAHVAWCERREDGRYWIGLALLESGGRRLLKVRPPGFVEADGQEVGSRRRADAPRSARLAGRA